MTDTALADKLSQLLATETRSLSRHLTEATPYLTLPTYAIWVSIRHLSDKASDHAKRLSSLFDRMGVTPNSVSYNPQVANYHYMSLQRLLPELIAEKQRQVKLYEQAISLVAARPRVKDVLVELEKENLAHLAQLQDANAKLVTNK